MVGRRVAAVTLVVITGATRRNGRAAAIELASQGAEVVVVGREPERVDAVAREASDEAPVRRYTRHTGAVLLRHAALDSTSNRSRFLAPAVGLVDGSP
jgi:NAD(P)-dependent dehydrogenase (short-subunit alcohol dehydrogenase family)